MCLLNYYERQAATSRRLAEHAITAEQARQLLTAANNFEQRAHQLCQEGRPAAHRLDVQQIQAAEILAGPTANR